METSVNTSSNKVSARDATSVGSAAQRPHNSPASRRRGINGQRSWAQRHRHRTLWRHRTRTWRACERRPRTDCVLRDRRVRKLELHNGPLGHSVVRSSWLEAVGVGRLALRWRRLRRRRGVGRSRGRAGLGQAARVAGGRPCGRLATAATARGVLLQHGDDLRHATDAEWACAALIRAVHLRQPRRELRAQPLRSCALEEEAERPRPDARRTWAPAASSIRRMATLRCSRLRARRLSPRSAAALQLLRARKATRPPSVAGDGRGCARRGSACSRTGDCAVRRRARTAHSP
eukprot:scaffold1058_cov362-Prasinococcus_capsulatus_cf.AAC.3